MVQKNADDETKQAKCKREKFPIVQAKQEMERVLILPKHEEMANIQQISPRYSG